MFDFRTEFDGNSISDYNHEFLKQYHDVISQVYISVKTTSRYHYPRLVILLETWVNLVKDNTWFFTDSPGDKDLVRRTGDHLIVTNCTSSHHRYWKNIFLNPLLIIWLIQKTLFIWAIVQRSDVSMISSNFNWCYSYIFMVKI